ncbi:MAG: hypothetical protein H6865_05690 [Rhodospirillales bacterium]|nr:hypothetical protein [Alphaproteobacteria bacterium]MCB9987113.1 hypothetical protein [Rhodospirillales bacterium]USO08128.1 MAG: hypothetical protein H6866_02605 [Rhodospirillales bacterium]
MRDFTYAELAKITGVPNLKDRVLQKDWGRLSLTERGATHIGAAIADADATFELSADLPQGTLSIAFENAAKRGRLALSAIRLTNGIPADNGFRYFEHDCATGCTLREDAFGKAANDYRPLEAVVKSAEGRMMLAKGICAYIMTGRMLQAAEAVLRMA